MPDTLSKAKALEEVGIHSLMFVEYGVWHSVWVALTHLQMAVHVLNALFKPWKMSHTSDLTACTSGMHKWFIQVCGFNWIAFCFCCSSNLQPQGEACHSEVAQLHEVEKHQGATICWAPWTKNRGKSQWAWLKEQHCLHRPAKHPGRSRWWRKMPRSIQPPETQVALEKISMSSQIHALCRSTYCTQIVAGSRLVQNPFCMA